MEEKEKNNSPAQKGIDFKSLIDIKEWQKIQDNFSVVTHIPMRTVDTNGEPLTSFSGAPRLCTEFLPESQLLSKLCNNCLPTFLGGQETVDKHLSFSCLVGLKSFIASLKIGPQTPIAYVIIGPVVLVNPESQSKYRDFAEKYNLNLTDLYSAITEIKVSSFNSILSMVELVEDVGNFLIKASYNNLIPQEETVVVNKDKLNKLLKVFLDVAFQVSGADLGSIMLLDKAKEELSIFASKGLNNDVIKNSRIKFGEGISGTVAKEKTSILIDDNIKNNRIKSLLTRPNLKSSMILPIKFKEDVLGVVNLSTTQSSQVIFNPNDLKLMNRLVDLVGIALR